MKAFLLVWQLFFTLALLAPGGAAAAPIPAGFAKMEAGAGTNTITVFTYKPVTYAHGPLVVVFHGIARNAEEYCRFAVPLAKRLRVIVAAPLFDTNQLSNDDYGLGGVTKNGVFQPRENWAFARLPEIVRAVRQREARPDLPYYLIGHSGGGQFVMRLAALFPTDARRIIAANPGSDMFPRRDWAYGYGFGGLPKELSDDAALQRYLAAPLTLCLGLEDIDPNHPALPRTVGAELQGKFRLARGRACFEFAKNVAQEHGWAFNWRKVEVARIGHDGKAMLAARAVQDSLLAVEKDGHAP